MYLSSRESPDPRPRVPALGGFPEPAAVPLLDLIASILIWSPDGNPKMFHEGD
jgi:hypothetical protein